MYKPLTLYRSSSLLLSLSTSLPYSSLPSSPPSLSHSLLLPPLTPPPPPLTPPSPHPLSSSLHLFPPPLTTSLPLSSSLPLLLLPPPSPYSCYSFLLLTTSLPSRPPSPCSSYSPLPPPSTLQRDLLAMLISQTDICQPDLTSSVYEAVGKDDVIMKAIKE